MIPTKCKTARKKLNWTCLFKFWIFCVPEYAKLPMLQFYSDFLDKHIDRSDFEHCEMDTDSAYIAISGESVEDLVKAEMMHEFENDNYVIGFLERTR